MNVFFPLDIRASGVITPYVLQLLNALVNLREVSSVGHGVASIYWPKPRWDVIHVQWPEAMVSWRAPNPDKLDAIGAILEAARGHASIIATIHNYQPQAAMGAAGPALFDMVFRNCDAFVHLGQHSRDWFLSQNRHHDWCTRAIHEVIGHGPDTFYDQFEQDEALVPSRFPLSKLFLAFGTLRNKEELILAENAFRRAQLPSAKLMFAGQTAPDLKIGKSRRVSDDPAIIRYHKSIPNRQVKPLFRAADFVFVPRSGRLNSAVVPLAFTFDVPVIGPDEGVIGELIRAVSNITYAPGDERSAANALRTAYSLSAEEYAAMCARVRDYREKHMDWPTAAKQHVMLYKRTRPLSKRFRSAFAAFR